MSEMTCEQFGELADELALGLLAGPVRARALAHANRCDACAAELRELTAVSDGLLGLLPGREPPIGFENRMMSRLGLAEKQRRHRTWFGAAAVAAIIATVFALGGFALGSVNNPGSPAPTVLSATLTAGDHPVGSIYTATRSPSWVYMTIDTEQGTGTVSCQLQQRDGHLVTLGTFTLKDGYGYWGAPSPVDPATVVSARVVADDGTVIATADFLS
ncbi:MAG: hypothetical protein ACXVGB_10330 [Mycobacteriaceae bacterium]